MEVGIYISTWLATLQTPRVKKILFLAINKIKITRIYTNKISACSGLSFLEHLCHIFRSFSFFHSSDLVFLGDQTLS